MPDAKEHGSMEVTTVQTRPRAIHWIGIGLAVGWVVLQAAVLSDGFTSYGQYGAIAAIPAVIQVAALVLGFLLWRRYDAAWKTGFTGLTWILVSTSLILTPASMIFLVMSF